MRKTGMPERDELVICRITKLHPNSAFAILVEYDKTGMIHVSEVAKRWVRDIREFVKENQYVVCRVMKVEGDHIFLSIKRVAKEQANSKLNEFKRERKAEKMLELAGKELDLDLNKSYEDVGYKLQDEFGSLFKAFEFAMNDPELLKSKGIPDKWVKVLSDIAAKNYVEKEYHVKASLKLVSYQPDGIKVIRNALSEAESSGLEVKYISAPKYLITGKGKKHKQVEAKVNKAAENVVKKIKQSNGLGEFKILEE
jgi:translation initiation factor 2 subunit 1